MIDRPSLLAPTYQVCSSLSRFFKRLPWLALCAVATAHAAPPAGTQIGNQAAATYTDASSVSRTATSNAVSTVVQQVAALSLASSQNKVASPGAPVSFAHTLTNSGNGSDVFNLSVSNNSGDDFDFSGLAVYADANCDGIADGVGAITVSPTILAGDSVCIVVQGTVAGVAGNGQVGRFTLSAVSQFNGAVSATNTDAVAATANAAVSANKSISAPSGDPGTGPYTVTLSYTNTGNTAATNLVLRDSLPAGMSYVLGSGRWSPSGVTVLGDGAGADPAGLSFDFGVTQPGTVTAVIATVAPNVSGTISFQVTIAANQGTGTLTNTAYYCFHDGMAQVPLGCSTTAGGIPTNTVPFGVNQVVGVRANGSSTDSAINNAAVPVAAAAQGSTLSFDNYVWNLGNGTDSYDMTLDALGTAGNNFPAGTTFQLFKSDGLTPLVDTNGNGLPDTGAIPPFNTAACTVANGYVADAVNGRCGYRVVLRVTLSPSATGGPFSVTKTAISAASPGVFDTVTDTLLAITTSSVDLRNGAANSAGTGAGPEVSPVTTHTVNPGATATFVLKVNNTSAVSDTYDLAASSDVSFVSVTLPAGWVVTFRADGGAGDCTSTGAVIGNTGVVSGGAVSTVCALVAVPANAAAAPAPGTSVYFRVRSPSSGATDRKHDAVSVNTLRALAITINNSGQIFPGGSVVYGHTLNNNGNVLEGASAAQGVLSSLQSGVTAGWSNVIYWDRNNDGLLDASDPVVADLSQLTGGSNGASVSAGLDPGETVRLFLRVFAPGGAAIGDANVVTLGATASGTINGVAAPVAVFVTDTTTVIAGQVRLVKEQALDADCDGVPEGPYGQGNISSGALPGACVRYRVIASNDGTANVAALLISDATPGNTTYHDGTPACSGTLGSVPAAATTQGSIALVSGSCGAGASLQASVGALAPGQTAVMSFGVRIDP